MVTRSRVQDLRQKFLPPDEVEKRESRILERMLEERSRLEREAELEAERERNAWEEQGKRFLEISEKFLQVFDQIPGKCGSFCLKNNFWKR